MSKELSEKEAAEKIEKAKEKLGIKTDNEKLSDMDKKNIENYLVRQEEKENKYSNITSLNQTFGDLYLTEPFLGTVAAGITKIIDTKQPTAYVGVRANGKSHDIIMGLNPKFLLEQKAAQRKGVVKHELYHVILQHIFNRSIGEKTYAMLFNWATDLAINSLIGEKNLPEMCLIPGKHPIDQKTGKPAESNPYVDYVANAPLGKSSDYYFEQLRKIKDEQGDDDGELAVAAGIGTMDAHEQWQDVPDDVMDQIRDKVKELAEKGAIRAEQSNNWGSIPQEMSDYIKKMLSKQVDWRSVLKNFVGRTRSQERTSTVRRINKKVPYQFPGAKRKTTTKILACLDQSGSMSDEDIALMFGELRNLSTLTEIDVYHFDTEVDEKSHMVWRKSDANPKCMRTRAGGTDFQCVVDFCNRQDNRGKWSAVIILTDGYAPKCGQIVGAKVLWLITQGGTMNSVREGDLVVKMTKEQVNAKPKPY